MTVYLGREKQQERPFEQNLLLEAQQHDEFNCANRKILQKLEDVREKCFEQSKIIPTRNRITQKFFSRKP